MRDLASLLATFGALAAAWFPAGPAMAQATQSVEARATLLGELTLIKSEDLDFGGIAGIAAGTVAMTATASPTCTASAGLVHSGECQPATFIGKGQNGRIVRIKKPTADQITLTGPGANMTITNLVLDGNPELTSIQQTPGFSRFRINSTTGFFTFRLGGRLNIGANQLGGQYTGTFNIDINYD
jgi:hypothetical protein